MGVSAACGSARRARGVYRLYGCVIGLAFSTGLVHGCATGAYQQGERAGQTGDWDAAVASYRRALQEDPGRAEVRLALERTKLRAIWGHLDNARELEARDELTAALAEYRQALTYLPRTAALSTGSLRSNARFASGRRRHYGAVTLSRP